MNLPIYNLSADKFGDFGDILQRDQQSTENFQVIIDEPISEGWRIAINQVKREDIQVLGLHPNTRETFEPLSGTCILIVAKESTPENIEAFLLDQPVCINKNIWHATVSLSEYSNIKIVENSIVEQKVYRLKQPLNIGVMPL